MNICFLTNKYPNKVDLNGIVFLQQLVAAIARQGHTCTVICPVPTNINAAYRELPEVTEEQYDGHKVTVCYPRYFGLGQKKYLGFNPARITTDFYTKAVCRVIDTLGVGFEAVYGHFVTPAGIAAARVGRRYHIPSFLAYGEATYRTIEHFGKKKVKEELDSLSGVIAVSTQNREMIEHYVRSGITEIFPNAIDNSKFCARNKAECREKLGLDQDDFIVSFVGSFDDRKGIKRLSEAVNRLNGKAKLVAAGKGSILPDTPHCLISEAFPHDDLPVLLGASDVFALPTLHEGCCNAIVEAMACGLPIISSDRSFNYDILDETNAVLLDPTNIDSISDAIECLRSNCDRRKQMAKASLCKAADLTIERRAENILNFMESKIEK